MVLAVEDEFGGWGTSIILEIGMQLSDGEGCPFGLSKVCHVVLE